MSKNDYKNESDKELEKFASNTYTLIEEAIIIVENSPKDNMPNIDVFATLDGITAEWETERYSISVDYVIGQGSSLFIENKFGKSNKECKDTKEAVELAIEYIENDKRLNTPKITNSNNISSITTTKCPVCKSTHVRHNKSITDPYYFCDDCGYRWYSIEKDIETDKNNITLL